jgi:hypothetical protein
MSPIWDVLSGASRLSNSQTKPSRSGQGILTGALPLFFFTLRVRQNKRRYGVQGAYEPYSSFLPPPGQWRGTAHSAGPHSFCVACPDYSASEIRLSLFAGCLILRCRWVVREQVMMLFRTAMSGSFRSRISKLLAANRHFGFSRFMNDPHIALRGQAMACMTAHPHGCPVLPRRLAGLSARAPDQRGRCAPRLDSSRRTRAGGLP